jgi:hypothetical protein
LGIEVFREDLVNETAARLVAADPSAAARRDPAVCEALRAWVAAVAVAAECAAVECAAAVAAGEGDKENESETEQVVHVENSLACLRDGCFLRSRLSCVRIALREAGNEFTSQTKRVCHVATSGGGVD